MEPIGTISSLALTFRDDDVDTDAIIPARFLQTTSSLGLGDHLFADRRDDKNFPISKGNYLGQKLLLAGRNFGSGSSREHAVWALKDFGFRVIIAPSFGDIFLNNCLKNGLLAITIDESILSDLWNSHETFIVNLMTQTIFYRDSVITFDIDPYSKLCLVKGFDDFDVLNSYLPEIELYEKSHVQNIFPISLETSKKFTVH